MNPVATSQVTVTVNPVATGPISKAQTGKVYFFNGDEYLRYDMAGDHADPGFPQPIIGNWPGWPTSWVSGVGGSNFAFDSAVNFGRGQLYFFRGLEYLRYDIANDRVDSGYPKAINNNTWPGWPASWDRVDAVFNRGDGKADFFHGQEFLIYDIVADKAVTGPQPINGNWPGWPNAWLSGALSGAVNYSNCKVYFFEGREYLRYDVKANRVDSGYPKAINGNTWPGFPSNWVRTNGIITWDREVTQGCN